MRADPSCPRCGGPLQAPSVWSSDWNCISHGPVLPVQPPKRPSTDALGALLEVARVPVWLPWPLPPGWLVTGFLHAGDERTGARACGVALSGPAPLNSGPADLLVIAEEPGVGLGAHYSGLDGLDPGAGCSSSSPHAKIEFGGHPIPMWAVNAAPDDRAVYVGEALGNWLWMILWPAEAGALMIAQSELCDLREPGMMMDVPFGAVSPILR